MQKRINKPSSKVKKYGEPYARTHLLKYGDRKLIAKTTGFAYMNVLQQLDGTRRIVPTVKAMADKLADRTQAEIDAINNMNVNKKNVKL